MEKTEPVDPKHFIRTSFFKISNSYIQLSNIVSFEYLHYKIIWNSYLIKHLNMQQSHIRKVTKAQFRLPQ